MTRKFNQIYHCQHCGMESDAQTAFSRWMRENQELDSGTGTVLSDLDFIIHRWTTPVYGRGVQGIMFLEVKTNCAKVSDSQAKTLSMAKQFIFNQGDRRIKDGPKGQIRAVRNFGGFELRFSHTNPNDSDWIEWNRHRITKEQLVSLLKLDLNPISLKGKIDWRTNHHTSDKTLNLL